MASFETFLFFGLRKWRLHSKFCLWLELKPVLLKHVCDFSLIVGDTFLVEQV